MFKYILIICFALYLGSFALNRSKTIEPREDERQGSHTITVKGHWNNGKWVDPYIRTLPDGDLCNNINAPSSCNAQDNSDKNIPLIGQDSPIIESDHPEQNFEPEIEKYNAKSKRLRDEFEQIRPRYWKEVSKQVSASEKLSQENIDRMAAGKAPIGDDGFPMEVHHKVPLSSGGTNDFGNFKIMTRTQHRLGDNYCKNHPELPNCE